MKLNTEAAIKMAIEITEKNVESTNGWVSPEIIIDCLEKVYAYLTGSSKTDG